MWAAALVAVARGAARCQVVGQGEQGEGVVVLIAEAHRLDAERCFQSVEFVAGREVHTPFEAEVEPAAGLEFYAHTEGNIAGEGFACRAIRETEAHLQIGRHTAVALVAPCEAVGQEVEFVECAEVEDVATELVVQPRGPRSIGIGWIEIAAPLGRAVQASISQIDLDGHAGIEDKATHESASDIRGTEPRAIAVVQPEGQANACAQLHAIFGIIVLCRQLGCRQQESDKECQNAHKCLGFGGAVLFSSQPLAAGLIVLGRGAWQRILEDSRGY